MTGHCLGAAGVIEAIACIKSVMHDMVPPTINHFTDDPDLDPKLNFTFNKPQQRTVRAALSNTFGFGGHNACVIVKKYVAWDSFVKLINKLFKKSAKNGFEQQVRNVLGIKPGKSVIYRTALSHRSVKEGADENNERLEYLGDAILSAIIADYLFKRYPYRGEGFLTEMRSKMVNRQQLNEVALKMGLKKLTMYNKFDNALKSSQIFGNTLEAIVGAIYLDKGYKVTHKWVLQKIVIPHLYVDDLEQIDINLKNRLIGWASKNGKLLEFETTDEKLENGRRIFTIAAVLNGEVLAKGTGFNKKDASQVAAQLAIEKLKL